MIGPEFKLAVACCRSSRTDENMPELRALSAAIDWPKFLHLVRRHRIQGLAARALKSASIDPPGDVAASIEDDARSVGARNLQQAAESVRLLRAFSDTGLSILFIKGLTLSALAYGDPFVKMSSDIDILIAEDDLASAATVLSKLGYAPVIPADGSAFPALQRWHRRAKESVWRHADRDILLELHTRLADNASFIPPVGMGSPRQEVAIGAAGSLPTLAIEDLFAYLCVHGATSLWFRLKWIADVAALVAARGGPPEFKRLYTSACKRGAGRAPGQALLLADYIGLMELEHAFRSELEADGPTRLLAKVAVRELLHDDAPMQRPLGTMFTHLTQPLLMEGWRFKLGEVSRQVNDILQRRLGNA